MKVAKITYWVIFVSAFLLAIIQNLQGLEGYHGASSPVAAFDELYSIREVYTILTSSSFKTFALSIIAGKGYMYGRFIYLCDAIIAFIPFKIFGLNGLTFSIRMAHTIYLLLGFHFIIKYINKSQLEKIFSLILLVTLPVTLYFVILPKPEPMQLLFLGLFFNFRRRNWSWFFLGLALGTKISIAFSCLFIFSLSLWYFYKKRESIKSLIAKFGYGLAGLIIALPALPLSLFNTYFRNGLIHIVRTTTKPYDDPSITFVDWIIKWFHYFYALPLLISTLLASIILVATIFIVRKNKTFIPYFIFAILILLPIMILTKRMWGHYLFLGTAMLVPFISRAIEKLTNKGKYLVLTYTVVLAFFLVNIGFEAKNYSQCLNRNNTEIFKKAKTEMMKVIAYCNKTYPKIPIHIDIGQYHQYNWSIKGEGLTFPITNYMEYAHKKYIVASKDQKYLLEDSNYTRIKTFGSCALFAKE